MSHSVRGIVFFCFALLALCIGSYFGRLVGVAILHMGSIVTGRTPMGGPLIVNSIFWLFTAGGGAAAIWITLRFTKAIWPAPPASSTQVGKDMQESATLHVWQKALLVLTGVFLSPWLSGFLVAIPLAVVYIVTEDLATEWPYRLVGIASESALAIGCACFIVRARNVGWLHWLVGGFGSGCTLVVLLSTISLILQ